ncbi:diguanylate cyclase [Azoarcus olearius]|uniref:PAS domain S-box protein n=1 Tax=Azoarcus sp. (strain BH72) TaxID=418699 RepID=UPI000806291F|nr:PAS domain S-box protein [Azoarcus olearius]ANQ85875.1 diguanylate cyclase [Azoarcus olearius]
MPTLSSHHRIWLLRFVLVALAYFAGGRIGLSVPYVGSHITLIWPPTGIALAALLRWELSLWPAVWVGAFAVNLTIGSSPELAFALACGNTLGPWLAARWLRAHQVDSGIARRYDLVRYLAVGVLGGMAVNATNGITQLWLAGIVPGNAVPAAWLTWWLGDAMGALVLGIPLLTARRGNWQPLFSGRRRVELLSVLGLTLTAGAVVFEGNAIHSTTPLLYLPFLLLCWLAIRGSAGLASTAALLLSAEAVWATAQGIGPFQASDLHQSLATLWGYMATATIITVLITVLIGETSANERRLRQIFETNHAIKLIVRPGDHRIVDANEAASAFYGHSLARLRTLRIDDIATEPQPFGADVLARLESESGWHLRTRHRLASGEVRDVEVYAGPVGSGADLRIYAIVHDITERSLAEQELRKFKFFNDNASDAYILIDEDARIHYVNRATCDLLGYTEAELLQLTIPDIDPHYDVARVRAHFNSAKQGRVPPFESEHQRRDGSRFPVEVTSTALQVDGRWMAFTAARDITLRKRVENELRKFRFISDNANDANFLLNPDGRFLYVNALACERLGYSEAELLQMSVPDIDPTYGTPCSRPWTQRPGDRPAPFETLHRCRDGRTIPVEITLTSVEFQGERLRFATARDITDRKRIEAAERRQRESLARLNEVSALSHLPLDEQLRRALAIVAAQLELPCGIVSRVQEGTYTVQAHVAPGEDLRDGQTFLLGDTYCDITLREHRVVAIANMGESRYLSHPCYRNFGLEAYIGAVVHVGGAVYGTVNFSAAQAYAREFDDADREFVELLARWVGSAIEADIARRQLAASEARLQTIIDTEPECVSLRTPDGRVLEMNAAGLALVEADSVEALNAVGLPQLVAPAYREAFAALGRRVSAGESATLEFEIVGLRGSRRWIDAHATALRDASGEVTAILSVARDVTQRRDSEAQLRLAATVFTHAHEGIAICDAERRIVDVNPTFCEITGYSRQEAIGASLALLNSGEDRQALSPDMWQTVARRGHWEGELWNLRKDGTEYAQRLTISAVYDAGGTPTHYIGTFSDITFVKRQQEQLEHLAHYDPLTGLPNRSLLADRLQLALAQARREESAVAVCYLDLDGFKAVNDELGHQAGDLLLVEIGRRLKDCVRAGDTVARLGGDEFVLLLLDVAGQEECIQAVSRVLAAIARPVTIAGEYRSVSASIGIALFPDDDDEPEVLLRHADQAMYLAKQRGKNCYQWHHARAGHAHAGTGLDHRTAADLHNAN